MSKKLTLHEKARAGFNLSCRLISFANQLKRDCRDFHQVESMKIAEEMEKVGEEYREKFRN